MNIKKVGAALISCITFSTLVFVNLGCDDCDGDEGDDYRDSYWTVLDDMSFPYDSIHSMIVFDFDNSNTITEEYFLTEDYQSWDLVRDATEFSPIQDISGFAANYELYNQATWDSVQDEHRVATIAALDLFDWEFRSFFVAYDTITKRLDFFTYQDAGNTKIEDQQIDNDSYSKDDECGLVSYHTYLIKASSQSGFQVFESLSYLEHAMWSKGDPFLDQEKEWLIDSIFDKDMNYLGTQAYDCLYDNSFTFYPGNKLLLSLGTEYCTPLDDPLLDQGQDFVYQQYLVVDEPTQDNPYILITTPGALFAPQRMYVLDYNQESALLSTTYDSDSIFMRVTAQ